MIRLITLTKKKDGAKCLVNPNKIVYIELDGEEGSYVQLDEQMYGTFKESPETIAALIELATLELK